MSSRTVEYFHYRGRNGSRLFPSCWDLAHKPVVQVPVEEFR